MDKSSILLLVVAISEVVALYLIWRVWKSDDHLLMKLALTLLAIIPVVGTLGVLWIVGFPPSLPHHLMKPGGWTDTTFTNRLDDARDNTEAINRVSERSVAESYGQKMNPQQAESGRDDSESR